MNKEELLKELAHLANYADREAAHGKADEALIKFIGDEEIEEAFDEIPKWYA